MAADPDLSELRPWLAGHEAYAKAVPAGDARFDLARQMLAIIAEARADLAPSADSTANYVPNKEIIEQLAILRDQAERLERKVTK